MSWNQRRPLPGSIEEAAQKIERLLDLEERKRRHRPAPSGSTGQRRGGAEARSLGAETMPASDAGHWPAVRSPLMMAVAREPVLEGLAAVPNRPGAGAGLVSGYGQPRRSAAAQPAATADDCTTCKGGCTILGTRCARLCRLFARSRLHLPICVAGCQFMHAHCLLDCNANLGCKPELPIA
jgi:hypothetical protein